MQVSIFEKTTELRYLCCVEGLISCDYPFVKILVEFFLIKFLALCKRRKIYQHTESNYKQATHLGLLRLTMEKIYNCCRGLFEFIQVSSSLGQVQYLLPRCNRNLIQCRRFVSAFEQDIKSIHGREAMLDMANQP